MANTFEQTSHPEYLGVNLPLFDEILLNKGASHTVEPRHVVPDEIYVKAQTKDWRSTTDYVTSCSAPKQPKRKVDRRVKETVLERDYYQVKKVTPEEIMHSKALCIETQIPVYDIKDPIMKEKALKANKSCEPRDNLANKTNKVCVNAIRDYVRKHPVDYIRRRQRCMMFGNEIVQDG